MTVFLLGRSALLDLVALGGPEALVLARAELHAGLRVQALVAGAHDPLLRHARGGKGTARGHLPAAAEEEDGHLDAGAADLHVGLPRVAHHVVGEGLALLEGPGARATTQHRLALDVRI